MEITDRIHKLLLSNNQEDTEIAMTILKSQKFVDFKTFIYNYRFRLNGTWSHYFDYYFGTTESPCLNSDGKSKGKTAMIILNWKQNDT